MNIGVIVLRLFIATLCGAVIGLERELKDKAAGLRTHILVCEGACLFGLLGVYMEATYANADILRLAQGLLIGMGFLGGGVIVREGTAVKGLTTAAGIWFMGAIGLSVGLGYYMLGLIGSLFGLAIITLFRRLERLVKR
ncbi:MAG: MgtC/SapB family protein [Candidatus Omnitrophica bacterium]|nr:MgtC/SapB family protein [Candidatus Omnitrophota bacterium]